MNDLITVPSHAPELRRRARHLCELAARIDGALVLSLPDHLAVDGTSDPRLQLCDRLLERSLHQLHRAADDLRATALRFRTRADELDAADGAAA